jgi:hypothetical protein
VITAPIREVHELELSSICNLACVYCPHPHLKRAKDHIGWDTFERALLHVEHYVGAGTQGELSLTGIGEAILHPRFIEALWMCRDTIGDRKLVLSTNGVALMNKEVDAPAIAAALAETRTLVYVSLHRPELATPAAHKLMRAGVNVQLNHAFVDSSIDWAGQVDWPVSGPVHTCTYLKDGWAVIRQNGNVDACCQDAHDLHPLANVWDEPGTWVTHPIELCAKCHLKVPEDFHVRAA